MTFVLDCSVTMAWLFPDKATGAAEAGVEVIGRRTPSP